MQEGAQGGQYEECTGVLLEAWGNLGPWISELVSGPVTCKPGRTWMEL